MTRRFSKFLPIIIFFSTLFCPEFTKSETNDDFLLNETPIPSSYLNSKKELEDYIIGSGDILFIEFYPAEKFTGFFPVNKEGEVYLPRLNEINVSGITPSELEKLLVENYSEFLISPTIKVKIAFFKEVNVIVNGEIRYPGSYSFPAYKSASVTNFETTRRPSEALKFDDVFPIESFSDLTSSNTVGKAYFQNQRMLDKQVTSDNDSVNPKTISDVIRMAGGITSSSDLSKVKVIRIIPLGKGGGKKMAVLNLNGYLNDFDKSNDLRIFDGDRIIIPALKNKDERQIAKSVITGLSPRFIEVNVYGRVTNPGTFKLPLEGTLSDAIDITGPIKPLSGKVVLIRYNNDGSIYKEKVSYSALAQRGSKRNPYVKEGDLITVTNSVLGKTTGVIKEITAPLQGIFFTKELIDNWND